MGQVVAGLPVYVNKFQFQSGAIQWTDKGGKMADYEWFQFQSGAIQWQQQQTLQFNKMCFNSKVVRFNDSHTNDHPS